MEACVLDSPVGHLLLQSEGEALTLLERTELPLSAPQHPLLCKAKAELESYFSGTLQAFSLPLRPQGTPFQQAVWAQLLQIPYGETRSYGDLARALGKPGAARAIGMANHRNPISILIPCHRVIGADGSLIGYGGGLDMKRFLLRLEGAAFREDTGRK